MSAIGLRGVVKAWGATRAVDGVSFEASAGRFVVLLGPSGCGKSTTLRLIAGLEQVSAGRVFIGDTDVTDMPPAKRQISMVFQSYALFPHLSVAENIVFGLKVRRLPAAERHTRLARVAALLGLDQLLGRKPSQLSGGQQQRVALGRALIAETPVCLMDEPLSNLDAQLRQEMRREIRALQQQLGITMVYVTHDQVEAMTMADQVVLLRDGRVEQDGTPEELYSRPATVFAARFIGTPPMNVVSIPALTGNGTLLGVRPEDIRIAACGAGGGVAGVVENVEYLGADSIVSCRIGAEAMTVRASRVAHLSPGTALRLSWPAEATHYFDAQSGKRVERAAPAVAQFVA
ncbi:MAG: ABC transporter ATP-binding protein [Proteobacteria bacterium]|nr:ABC transporter ATP-binding protein [Pseudomonadota bacterium]